MSTLKAKRLRPPGTFSFPDDTSSATVESVQFGIDSPDEIRSRGVVSVTNHRLYEKHRPAKDGLFDLRMGPTNREFNCETCGEGLRECPGHFGYIDLAVPVYHPLFMTTVCKILNCVCIHCSSLLVAKTDAFLRRMRTMRSSKARIKYIYESLKKKRIRTCGVCQAESKPAVPVPGTATNDDAGNKSRKAVRFTLPDGQSVAGGRSLWPSRAPDEFVVHTQPTVEQRRAAKNPDAVVTEEGCLAIQPRIMQEGPKLMAVWPDIATLYRFLVTGENDNETDDERDDDDDNNDGDGDGGGGGGEEEATTTAKKAAKRSAKRDATGKKKVKKASDATQADVASLLRRAPYFMPDGAKPAARDTFGASRALDVLKCLSDEDAWLLGFNPEYAHPAWMVLTVLAVPPPCLRPPIHLPNAKKALIQDHLTIKLLDIVKKNNTLHKQLRYNNKDWHDQYGVLLQWHVATYMDNTDRSRPTAKLESGKPIGCIVERWKGKKGRIRGNLMGKRCDFTARTTIGPDAMLKMDELGVPRSIAINLTYPERVTPLNIKKLQEAVLRGPDELLGAKYVIDEHGQYFDLRFKRDIALKVGWTVERTMRDGDIVLFNRQPSLHKMSMMGHRVRVMPGSTFRLNLAVTQPYNADFDGDEMNLHLPQSEPARTEVSELMMVDKHLITAQKNAPVMGLVQDSLLSVRMFTRRNTLIDRGTAMQVLYTLEDQIDDFRLPIPTILKSDYTDKRGEKHSSGPMWTGKQFVSMLLPDDLRLDTYAQFAESEHRGNPLDPADTHVIIREGMLLTGILDKKTCGSRHGSLVHVVNNDYGGKRAMKMLDGMMAMLHEWMMHHGFSVGIGDMMTNDQTRDAVQQIVQETRTEVKALADKMQWGELEAKYRQTQEDAFEAQVNVILNKARDRGGNLAHKAFSDDNALKLMETAGSKGSKINIAQISSILGQQNLTGERIPLQFKGNRPFPHCQPNDPNDIEGRGFVAHSYVDGLTPMEMFTHAIGGREGLTDTAIKTSTTGYLQRRLTKAMEDLFVAYDKTVRDSTNSILQFAYGEDDMDGIGVESQRVDLIAYNDEQMVRTFYSGAPQDVVALSQVFPHASTRDLERLEDALIAASEAEETIPLDGAQQEMMWDELARMCKLRDALREYVFRGRSDDTYWPLPCNVRRTIGRAQSRFKCGDPGSPPGDMSVRDVLEALQAFQERIWQSGDPLVASSDAVAEERQVDTTFLFLVHVLATLSPRRTLLEWRLPREAFEWVLQEMASSHQRGRIDAGESVGVLAGQAIGEPTMQMTLNSVDYEEQVVVAKGGGDNKVIATGQFIDEIIDGADDGAKQHYPGETTYVDVEDRGWHIPSVDEDGKTSWRLIEAVTRHLPINEDGTSTLLRVTTARGRTVTATKAKSFLLRRNNKIIGVDGSDVKVGDYLPVIQTLEGPPEFNEAWSAWRLDASDIIPGINSPHYVGDLCLVDIMALLQRYPNDEALIAAQSTVGTIAFDCIETIEEVPPTRTHVYDFTVEGTRNFALLNGLCVRDTFHSAGISSRNVTLGLPRLEELMKATKQIKTPSLTTYLTSSERRRDPLEEADRARMLANRMQYTCLRDLMKSSTVEHDPLPGTRIERDRPFVEQWYTTEPPPSEPLGEWVVRLVLNREEMAEREYSVTQVAMCLRQALTTTERRYVYVVASDDNDYEEGDGGIVRLRIFQHVLERHVDSKIPERDCMPDPTVFDRCSADRWAHKTYRSFAKHVQQYVLGLYVGGIENITKVSARQVKRVLHDRHTGKLLDNQKEWVLETDGSNMLGVMPLAGIDGRRVVSNHPNEVASVLGVEAARQVLLNEMRSVISFYGLYVNYRHLSLLCDFMTHLGTVRAISRHTLNKRRTGALMRCTFEQPVDVLRDAALYSEVDRLNSVSQCIIMGKPMPHGTGMMGVMLDDVSLAMSKPKQQCVRYLEETVTTNPFDKDTRPMEEDNDDDEDRENGDLLMSVANPFDMDQKNDNNNDDNGDDDDKDFYRDQQRGRIVTHNPFAMEHPIMGSHVVQHAQPSSSEPTLLPSQPSSGHYVPSSPGRPLATAAAVAATTVSGPPPTKRTKRLYLPSSPGRT